MKAYLAILLWASDPDAPHRCATPFFSAATAAAMDVEVVVHFSARSVLLLVQGVAAALYGGGQRDVTIYEHMQRASAMGAKFLACSDGLYANGVDRSLLIPELSGIAGSAAFVGRALDPEWSALVF